MHYRLRRIVVALSLALAAAGVHADELQDINHMMKQGQLPQALERIDKYLANKPRDAQGRFLKGLILTNMNRPKEAIQVFKKLSEDYPELPEPYNNLAVLYASQGQYDKARIALESSIRTHPSYATAHENLGDIYAKLASQAYDKALQLDSSNTGAKTKLALIGELISSGGRAAKAGADTEPAKTAKTAPAQVADAGKAAAAVNAKPAEEAKATEPKKEMPKAPTVKATEPKPAVAKATEPKAAEPKAAEPKAAASSAGESEQLIDTVKAWAAAWSRQDVPDYLAHYAKDFKTPKGEPRSAWEKLRRQRLTAPKQIEVEISSPKVTIDGESTASVRFHQDYRSNIIKASGTKTLSMVKRNGKWLIREERVN